MKAYGYARVSTKGQATDGYGLDVQKDSIAKYCAENHYQLVNTYVDAGISGVLKDDEDEPSKRIGLMNMIEDLRNDKDEVDVVIVLDTDRLWRNLSAADYVQRKLRKAGVELFSIHQPEYQLHPDSSKKLYQGMGTLLAEWEHDKVTKRLEEGRNKSMEMNRIKPAGRLPFGYKRTYDKKSVEIDSSKAVIVKAMYELAAEKYSCKEILDILRAEGKGTYTDESNTTRVFNTKAIERIIHNDYYAGIVTWGGEKFIGSHQPIINFSFWKKVNPNRNDVQAVITE